MRRCTAPTLLVSWLSCLACLAACDTPDTTTDTTPEHTTVGAAHAGDYSLGPVAFTGSFWNSCAPYTPAIEQQIGPMLAGLALKWNGDGSLCDACILLKTGRGRSVIARVITTGETHGPNDVDLSQAAFDAVSSGEYPRTMTWELVACDGGGGKLAYQFQTEANPYWTSLWVRNPRLPIATVEVKSANHGNFAPLVRKGDGTFTDEGGFGDGPFTLRVTSIDGQVVTDTLPKIEPGDVVASSGQFR